MVKKLSPGLLLLTVLFIHSATAQNIFPSTGSAGIGTTTPNASALLEIQSTTKGLLISRMTKSQRDAIVRPAAGLMIFQTNTSPGFYYYNGTTWVAVSPKGANQSLSNLTAPTAVNVDLLPGTSGSLNLGAVANGWKNIYFNGSLFYGSRRALFLDTVNHNTAVGSDAFHSNTSGHDNTANGDQALYSNTNGSYNTATGSGSLYKNKTGDYNTANGTEALYFHTAYNSHTATGYRALYSDSSGFYNTANGESALYFNKTGSLNTANGVGALYYNTSGYKNTANGTSALGLNTEGNENTANGYSALSFNKIGSFNTALGVYADVSSGNLNNAMALGYTAVVNASNKVVVGNSFVTVIGGQVGWSIFSDGRFKANVKQNVPGLKFINKLNPVTYTLELKKFDRFIGKKDSAINSMQADYTTGEKKIRTGFIAQAVERVAKEINYDFDGVNHPQNDKDNYALVYADFVPSLVKAVQELSKMNDDKDAKINDLQKQIDELKTMIVSNQSIAGSQPSTVGNAASLGQNIPNPFDHTTTINYTLPQSYASAKIIVVDNSGKVVKEANLNGSGKGNLKLDIPAAASGVYNYSLYVNGKLVDTKKMLAAK